MGLLGLFRDFMWSFLHLIGLVGQPGPSWPESGPGLGPMPASLVEDLLPSMKFRDFKKGTKSGPGPGFGSGQDDPPERCTVCLGDFHDQEEIRRLRKCGHIFHRGCVDRWMEHEQRTCPLCRTHFIPQEWVEAFNEARKCSNSAANLPEFGGDFSPINFFCS